MPRFRELLIDYGGNMEHKRAALNNVIYLFIIILLSDIIMFDKFVIKYDFSEFI